MSESEFAGRISRLSAATLSLSARLAARILHAGETGFPEFFNENPSGEAFATPLGAFYKSCKSAAVKSFSRLSLARSLSIAGYASGTGLSALLSAVGTE